MVGSGEGRIRVFPNIGVGSFAFRKSLKCDPHISRFSCILTAIQSQLLMADKRV